MEATRRWIITSMIWILTPKGRLKMNTATLIFDTRQTNKRTNYISPHTSRKIWGMIYVTTRVFTLQWFRLRIRRLVRSTMLREAASSTNTTGKSMSRRLRINSVSHFGWPAIRNNNNNKVKLRLTQDSQGVSFFLTARLSSVDQIFKTKKQVKLRATLHSRGISFLSARLSSVDQQFGKEKKSYAQLEISKALTMWHKTSLISDTSLLWFMTCLKTSKASNTWLIEFTKVLQTSKASDKLLIWFTNYL